MRVKLEKFYYFILHPFEQGLIPYDVIELLFCCFPT